MISVVVAIFNGEKYIKRCFESILSQDYDDYEVIAVNDGSTDHSLEVLERYKEKVRIISQTNQGVASARNTGIRYSLGEYICFIDVDDYIESNYLSLLFNSLEDDVQVCFSGYKRKEGDVITLVNTNDKIVTIDSDDAIFNTFIPRLTSGILRTDVVKEIMFDDHCDVAYEDFLFQIQLLSKVQKIKYVAGTPYIFEYNKDSVSSTLNSYKLAKKSFLNAYCAKKIINIIKDYKLKTNIAKNAVDTFVVYISNCYKWNIDIKKDIYIQNVSLLKELEVYMPYNVRAMFFITKHFPKLVSHVYALEQKRK